MSDKKAVDVGGIKIKGIYEIMTIVDFQMIQEKNKHAEVFVKGFVSEEEGDKCINQNEKELTIVKKSECEEVIFSGFIRKIDINYQRNCWTILIYGISASILLEGTRKFRSFQDITCTGEDIIKEVLKDTREADAMFHMSTESIKKPLIQYDETDWEFILRVCSLYHASVFVDIESGKPCIYCGLPQKGVRESLNAFDEIWEFDESYYSFLREKEQNKKIVKRDFLTVNVHTYEAAHIGEQISTYEYGRVQKQMCTLKNGLLVYTFKIANERYSESYPVYNKKIRGTSILGKVIDVKGESIKIWLSIDEKQNKDTAYWYHWLPESGNGFYCMPEIGAQVYLYVTGKDEKDAIAIGCRNEGEESRQDRTNPQGRELKLDSLKKMDMFSGVLGFSNERKEKNKVEIDDSTTISFESYREMTIYAENAIALSGKKILFQAPGEISIIRKDMIQPTVINMSSQFDAIGRYMNINADGGSAIIPVINGKKNEQYSLEGLEKDIIASTPYIGNKVTEEIDNLAIASKVNMPVDNLVIGERVK